MALSAAVLSAAMPAACGLAGADSASSPLPTLPSNMRTATSMWMQGRRTDNVQIENGLYTFGLGNALR